MIQLTTTPRTSVFEILEEHFVKGGLSHQSYATPRIIATLKHEPITKHADTVSGEAIEQLLDRAVTLLRGVYDPYDAG